MLQLNQQIMKIKDKFVLCLGCRKKMTINYTDKQKEKQMKCPYCGKVTNHKFTK